MFLKISALIDTTNSFMGKLVSFFTVTMAITMFTVVVMRYGFNSGSIAIQESITYMHAAVFLLGSAFTYQYNGHVRVDVFYRSFSELKQNLVDLLGCLLFMLPIAIYFSIVCHNYVIESWTTREGSMEPGGLPYVYLLKSFLLVFSYSLVLQSVSEIIKHLFKITAKLKPEN